MSAPLDLGAIKRYVEVQKHIDVATRHYNEHSFCRVCLNVWPAHNCICEIGMLAALVERVEELQESNTEQWLKLNAADCIAKAVDAAVQAGWLGSRTTIADARLSYGEPGKYEYAKQAPPR